MVLFRVIVWLRCPLNNGIELKLRDPEDQGNVEDFGGHAIANDADIVCSRSHCVITYIRRVKSAKVKGKSPTGSIVHHEVKHFQMPELWSGGDLIPERRYPVSPGDLSQATPVFSPVGLGTSSRNVYHDPFRTYTFTQEFSFLCYEYLQMRTKSLVIIGFGDTLFWARFIF